MRVVYGGRSLDHWRRHARRLLQSGVVPEEVLWMEEEESLFGSEPEEGGAPQKEAQDVVRVPPAFMELARVVSVHRAPERWGVLYRILWRMTRGMERGLLAVATDRDVRAAELLARAVRRDLHKMHAFVRFRRVGSREEREQYVSWFEPGHRIVRLAAPFFQKRFTGMDWSILTPEESVHWDGVELQFTAGVERGTVPDGDALEGLWRTYYRSIFNPARLKVKAMQAEMPKKYWANLPEAECIGELIAGSRKRVEAMLATEERPVKPEPQNAYLERLKRLEGDCGNK
jgi:probable DNA metabolism protein